MRCTEKIKVIDKTESFIAGFPQEKEVVCNGEMVEVGIMVGVYIEEQDKYIKLLQCTSCKTCKIV